MAVRLTQFSGAERFLRTNILQDRVAARLTKDGIFNCQYVTNALLSFVGESILEIGQHLAKLGTKL